MKTGILGARILGFQLTGEGVNLYNDVKNIAIWVRWNNVCIAVLHRSKAIEVLSLFDKFQLSWKQKYPSSGLSEVLTYNSVTVIDNKMFTRAGRVVKNSDSPAMLWIFYSDLINNLWLDSDYEENKFIDLKGLSSKLIVVIHTREIQIIAILVNFNSADRERYRSRINIDWSE